MADPVHEKPEAIVLIHGMDGKTPGEILNKLERGIADSRRVDMAETLPAQEVGSRAARVLELDSEGGGSQRSRQLHLYGNFWGDLIDRITDLGIRQQIGRGFGLIYYWVRTPIFKTGNRYITLGGCLTTLGMLLWWYGLLITALGAAIPLANGESESLSEIFGELAAEGGIWAWPLRFAQVATSIYTGIAAIV